VTDYFFRIRSFISWWLEAVDEHSLHSPFFFDLYTTHIKPAPSRGTFGHIESLRKKLLNDHRFLTVRDLGSGDKHNTVRRISTIARTNLSKARYSAMYARMAAHFNAVNIVELGSSFGINTLYLAENPRAHVTTFEGAPVIADIAALTFEFAGKKNIDLVIGNIDRTLPAYLQRVRKLDLVFLDANHRFEPTLQYFELLLKKVHEKSVMIIDDIHSSPEMQRAWTEIKSNRLVYASADLFRCGMLFFDPSLNKQHVILQV
jgi:predicted O-methyltransferase YrrM